MKIRSRILISLIVFMALVVAAPAGFSVYAETLDAKTYQASTPLDNDGLFESYVEKQFALRSAPAESRSRGSKLTGLNKTIYNLLRPEIKKTADGERTSTVFEVTVSELGLTDTTWTAEDLGVDSVVKDGEVAQAAANALLEKLDIRVPSIVNALVADCPYDLYWFDKVAGVSIVDPEISSTYDGTEWALYLSNGITLSFAVAQNYSDGEYTVNTTNAERVKHAVSKAADIVKEAKDKTDYEKLLEYKEKICALVSYDNDAANAATPVYGDSWQLISIFDEDTDTNVVCEGYSKAFQYLCDLTSFEGDISCISVTGNMTGGTGAGEHMWNIVNMEDNYNYLVDVTNCDEDSVGFPDHLFLAGYSTKNGIKEYEFFFDDSTVVYEYDTNTIETFDSDELEIRESSYEFRNPLLWTSYRAESFAGGSGTKDDPYEISCGEELALLAYYVNKNIDPYVSSYYSLTSDIDLGEHLWVPIGGAVVDDEFTVFKGHFNGNKRTIKNMRLGEGCGERYIGLFGATNNAVIENVRIEDAFMSINNTYTFVLGIPFEGFVCVGTLAGEFADSEMYDCSIVNMNCLVQSNASVFFGGLAGHLPGGVATESSVSGTASLISDKGIEAGGLFGDCLNASISKCDFRGKLSADNTNAPTLDGEWSEYEFGHQVGGLIGRGSDGYISLDNCYAHVKIIGKSYEYMVLGGLFGFMNLPSEASLSCHNTYCKCEMARRELNDLYSGYQGLTTAITEGHFINIRIGSSGANLDFENVGFFDDEWFWKLDDYKGAGDELIPTTKYKSEDYSTKDLFENVLHYSDEIWKIQSGYYPVFNGESSVGLPDDYLNEWLFYDNSLLSDLTMSGKCGDNATWKYSDGVLTISGKGSIYDYRDNETGRSCAPWKDLIHWTRKIVVEEGITGIGIIDFYDNYSVKEVYLPGTLLNIKEGAFFGSFRLDKVYYASSEADWQMVTVEGINDELLQADFIYDKCQALTAHEAREAKCTEPGNKAYWTCDRCGRVFADANAENEITKDEITIPALQHKWGSWTELDENQHQRVCENDSTHLETESHVWDEGVITKAASADEAGEKTCTCSVCGGTKIEIIPMTDDVDPITPSDVTANAAPVDDSIPKVSANKIKTAANITKKQMKVTFPAADTADNYRIQYRVAGKSEWTSDWSAGTGSYVIKGLKKSSLCEFRIAGYVKQADGSWARGAWSKVAYRYMSAVSAKTIKAGRKSLTVTWAKDKKASGYQVQYSLKKNMAGAKTKKVNGTSKTKLTIKKLKSGKKYYVKVRPIKKSGKTYIGILSKGLAVKVK